MLLGAESWDIFHVGDITDWWQFAGDNPTIVAGAGRCGSAAYHTSSTLGTGPSIGVNTSVDGGYCGFAIDTESLTGVVNLLAISGAAGNPQILLQIFPNGSIQCYSGPLFNQLDSRFLCATPPGLITAGHYYHIGVEWLCVSTGGYVKIFVNGVLFASVSGVNTRSGTAFAASSPWRMLTFGGGVSYLDDIYWGDSSGSLYTTFLGDLRVEGQVVLTDAAGGGGTHHDFSPSSGTDHGALVDEIPPDDDATYLQSGTVGDKETFKFPNITLTSGTVYGIQLMPNVKKTDSGGRTIACLTLSGGVLFTGASKGPSQTHYTYQPEMDQVDPTTGLPWTAATANAEEGGITITA